MRILEVNYCFLPEPARRPRTEWLWSQWPHLDNLTMALPGKGFELAGRWFTGLLSYVKLKKRQVSVKQKLWKFHHKTSLTILAPSFGSRLLLANAASTADWQFPICCNLTSKKSPLNSGLQTKKSEKKACCFASPCFVVFTSQIQFFLPA